MCEIGGFGYALERVYGYNPDTVCFHPFLDERTESCYVQARCVIDVERAPRQIYIFCNILKSFRRIAAVLVAVFSYQPQEYAAGFALRDDAE